MILSSMVAEITTSVSTIPASAHFGGYVNYIICLASSMPSHAYYVGLMWNLCNYSRILRFLPSNKLPQVDPMD